MTLSDLKHRRSTAAASPERAVDLTSKPERTSAPMPHERDEGVGMTDGQPDPRMRQGERDLKRGVRDTSRATEADRAYEQLKRD